jgi:tripartite-type tricarboxylate transporter receptor subunit TctC
MIRPGRARTSRRLRRLVGLLGAILVASTTAQADESVESFYSRTPITLIVSTAAGGGVDAYSRLLGRHLGRHVPGNPRIIVQNMPGAAGLKAAHHLFNVAAKDGSVIGHVQRGVLIEPLFGKSEINFDATKVSWIGSLNTEWAIGIAGGKSGLTSLDEALRREFPVAAEGPTASDYIYTSVLNSVLGTRFKIVSGYSGKPEELLAIERGEVAGLMGWAASSAQALVQQKIDAGELKVIASFAPERRPGYEKVPTVYEYAKSEEDRQVLDFMFGPQVLGRPHFAPPGVPADRLEALRRAFDATMKDEAFLADARKSGMDLDPFSGEEIEKRIRALYATPPAIIERGIAARQQRKERPGR